ncbi:MAG TPA: nuclear transport factor 2 family protein [Halobacteriales archaeon]|nr:nuclear transport factor 2 family protein [Halobacteriales archaeon]
MTDAVEATLRDYYDALRAGEPIHPFFADEGPVVKVGIGERLVGADAVAAGLSEQSRTTTDWVVESRDLRVGTLGDGEGTGNAEFAWFGDDVFMGWTDTGRGIRFEFETRWSGAMARRDDEAGREWRFVEMHVSVEGDT